MHDPREGAVKLGRIPDGDGVDAHPECPRRRLCFPDLNGGGRTARIPEEREAGRLRNELAGKFEALPTELATQGRDTGHVPPRPGQARHGSEADGIRPGRHDDRDRRRRLPRGRGGGRARRHDGYDLQSHEVGRERRQPLGFPIRASSLVDHGLAFDIPELAHPLAECLPEGRPALKGADVQKPDPRHRAGGLGARTPRIQEAESKKEAGRTQQAPEAPRRGSEAHWMISSARASTAGGIVRPRAFAVLRLMTSSNLVGCWMGRSPGLAPFRILSTYVAERRKLSRRSTA